MTREQAEANWVWDPQRGDVRPEEWPKRQRIPCIEKNIKAQQALARPGTLIHTSAKTTCPRKKAKTDERIETHIPTNKPRRSNYELQIGEIKSLAIASFIENVNCLWCRRDYYRKPNGKQ